MITNIILIIMIIQTNLQKTEIQTQLQRIETQNTETQNTEIQTQLQKTEVIRYIQTKDELLSSLEMVIKKTNFIYHSERIHFMNYLTI